MDAVTLSNEKVQSFQARFSFVRLDAGENEEDVKSLEITGFPAMIFLTSDGKKELKRLSGFYQPDAFIQEMEQVLADLQPGKPVDKAPPATAQAQKDIPWLSSLEEGKKQAADSNRQILVKVDAAG